MPSAASQLASRTENQILLAARMVREYYFAANQTDRHDWILILAIRELLDQSPDATPQDLLDLLITDSKIKTDGHLSRYLAASLAADAASTREKTGEPPSISVFTGSRRFSFSKLSAMAAFITLHCRNVCRHKLNLLLFYGDFVNFYLHDHSISGARYIRRPFGPVLYRYENLLRTLAYSGVVRIEGKWDEEDSFIRPEYMILGELTVLETVTMFWVLTNFGTMSETELTTYAHREIAYRFTRQDGFIAYEYARLLQILPERSKC